MKVTLATALVVARTPHTLAKSKKTKRKKMTMRTALVGLGQNVASPPSHMLVYMFTVTKPGGRNNQDY